MEMHVPSEGQKAEADGIDFDANDHEVEQPPSPSMVKQHDSPFRQKEKL